MLAVRAMTIREIRAGARVQMRDMPDVIVYITRVKAGIVYFARTKAARDGAWCLAIDYVRKHGLLCSGKR